MEVKKDGYEYKGFKLGELVICSDGKERKIVGFDLGTETNLCVVVRRDKKEGGYGPLMLCQLRNIVILEKEENCIYYWQSLNELQKIKTTKETKGVSGMIFIKDGKEFEAVLFDGTVKCIKQLDSLFFNSDWICVIDEQGQQLKIKNKKYPTINIYGVKLEGLSIKVSKGNYVVMDEKGDFECYTEKEFNDIFRIKENSKDNKNLLEENKKLKEIIKLMSEFM